MNNATSIIPKRAHLETFFSRVDPTRGRLIFAVDATASWQPAWDLAARLQSQMFRTVAAIGGLDVQLVYFRGYEECVASRWLSDAKALAAIMSRVTCAAGHTQFGRVLAHARKEHAREKVNAEQQPESYSERTGRKDLRSSYGLHGREMILWLNQLQHARNKNVVFCGILERVVDELKHVEWQLQAEGSKTSRELPGIVDQIISYQFLDFGDGKPPMRGFVCTNPNPWGYPAKDRSGRLDQIEEPDLGKLLAKLTNHRRVEND